MTWIKICGTTNLEDALGAVDAGADAVGFVFYEKSPRNIDVETARKIVQKLPKDVEKVGVFVDHEAQKIHNTVLKTGLTAVQLHGKLSMESVWQDQRPAAESVGVSKLIPMVHGDTLKDGGILIRQRAQQKIFAVLLDSRSDEANGGTGTSFDWAATRGILQSMSLVAPVIVAGGLTPLNVAEAMALLQPFGVDVVSGVEARLGKKDQKKVRAFVNAVRGAEKLA